MKAVILEINGEDVVAMKDDGTIVKMKNENYLVGGVIEMKENKVSLKKKWATLVAALLIFAMVGTGTWANASKAYDVIVEGKGGNEIVIEVNRSKEILSIDLEDYEKVLYEDDFVGMNLTEALNFILNELRLNNENISVNVVANDEVKAEKFAAQIKSKMEKDLAKENKEVKDDEDEVITNGMGYKMVEAARELEITPGKYNLITRHLGINPNNKGDMKKYATWTNQEIMKEYQIQKAEDKTLESKDKEDKDNVNDNNRDKDKIKEDNRDKDKDKVKEEKKDKLKDEVKEEEKIQDKEEVKYKEEENKKDKVKENSTENNSNKDKDKEKQNTNNGKGNNNANGNK